MLFYDILYLSKIKKKMEAYMGAYIVVAIIAYLIGSISFAVIFGKKFGGIDVRTKGSGNAGSTNVLRTVGKKAALCSVVCDILKGVVAVLIAVIISKIFKSTDGALLVQIAALCVVIGHTFPIFFKFSIFFWFIKKYN
jgi:glycerol-3-phosphate acyltransferase PlsY